MLIEHKNKSQENQDKMENYLNGQVSPNQAQELKQEPDLDLSSDSSDYTRPREPGIVQKTSGTTSRNRQKML